MILAILSSGSQKISKFTFFHVVFLRGFVCERDHEAIIKTRKTYKKFGNQLADCVLLKVLCFEVKLNIFEFSHV